MPVDRPDSPMIEPAERSIPPVMITIVCPMAAMAVRENARATPSRLSAIKNTATERQEGAEDDQGDEDVELFDPSQPAKTERRRLIGEHRRHLPQLASDEPPLARERRRSASWCSLLPGLR